MSRDDGFAVADTDTGLMADPKVLALARRVRDTTRTLAAVALWDAVRLASWKAGRRLTLDETLPGWVLDPVDDLADHLVAVGLLDAERRVPEHSWEGWFGPARDRRDRFRVLGARGGVATRDARAVPPGAAPGTPPAVARPSVLPSDRPGPAAATAGNGPRRTTEKGPVPVAGVLGTFAEEMAKNGWPPPPTKGKEDKS